MQARELGVTPSAVSQHLRVLKDLGLVRGERPSYWIHYFLDQERLAEYRNLTRDLLGEAFVAEAALAEPALVEIESSAVVLRAATTTT